MRKRKWLGSLGWRLLAAFLTVAVSAVALLALVAAVSVDRRSAALADQQRSMLRNEIASALAAAYTAGSGAWQQNNLSVVTALATAQGMDLVVLDDHGREVAHVGTGHGDTHDSTHPEPGSTLGPNRTATPATSHDNHDQIPATTAHGSASSPEAGHDVVQPQSAGRNVAAAPSTTPSARPMTVSTTAAAGTGESTTIPILVNGQQVGSARLALPSATPAPVSAARAALLRQVGLGAALAVLLATVASVLVSRRLSRPLIALAAATRAFAAGDPHPDTPLRAAPGEIGEVGRAFTDMAATVRDQDELRRAVIADVAHELRTPVTILRGQTEQLLDGIAEPTPERLVSLHDEVLRLERLTDDLATLSAADAAGLALRPGPVDLGKLAERTVEAMSAQFEDAELQVSVDTDNDVVVHGDPERLAQVMTNLLTNAAKFTPPGGQVSVCVRRPEREVVLTITDTGPGIAADELPHVFERFWRGRAAGSRSGTGVGLAVVHTLIGAHGGTITAASPPGAGARFTVRLPAADPQQNTD